MTNKNQQKQMSKKGFKYIDNKNSRMTLFEDCSEEIKNKIAAETANMTRIPIDLGDFLGDEYKGLILDLRDFKEHKDDDGNVLFYYKIKPQQFLYLLTNHPNAHQAKELALKQHMDSISRRVGNGIIIDERRMLIFTDAKDTLREAGDNMKNNYAKAQPGIHPEMESIRPEMFEDTQEE